MLTCTDTLGSKGGRIPSSLVDVYVRYKQDTRAIIAWLISHGTSKYKRLPTLSIKDLLGLAEIAQVKAVELPEIVDFHFREAIAARTQLSGWFRAEGVGDTKETSDHEFFTQRWVGLFFWDECLRSGIVADAMDFGAV